MGAILSWPHVMLFAVSPAPTFQEPAIEGIEDLPHHQRDHGRGSSELQPVGAVLVQTLACFDGRQPGAIGPLRRQDNIGDQSMPFMRFMMAFFTHDQGTNNTLQPA
jgi:hypothetical protein